MENIDNIQITNGNMADRIIKQTDGNSAGLKRIDTLDVVKGLGAMMVVMSHLAGSADINVPNLYSVFFQFFMIPCFFFVSGYLLSPKKNLFESLYHRIGKLIILYFLLSYLAAYINLSFWKQIIAQPILILTNLWTVFLNITIYAGGFLPYMIIATIISLLLLHVLRERVLPILILSLCIAIIGYIFRYNGGQSVWSWDTALVCQLFMIIGWIFKCKKISKRIITKNWIFVLVSGVIYIGAVVILYLFADYEWIKVNVALNIWGYLPITIPMIICGNIFIFSFSKLISCFKPLSYVGKHSLIYFYFASHAASITSMAINWIVEFNGDLARVLLNNYIASIYITILATAIMMIPCLIIDKFLPFINGQFKMPAIKFARKQESSDDENNKSIMV